MMENKSVPQVRFKGYADAWVQRKLGEVADFSKGSGYSKQDLRETGNPIILYGRLYTQYETVITNIDTFTEEKPNSVRSKGNEVIVPASGESAEDIARASVVVPPDIILGGDLNIIHTHEDIEPTFLALTISNGQQQKEMSKRAQGKSVVHLYNSDLKEVVLKYPSLPEQTAIGHFFRTLDETITTHKRKLEGLKELKRGYLQVMFPQDGESVPKVRFAGFEGGWESKRLGEIVEWKKGDRLSKNSLYKLGIGMPALHYADLYKFNPVEECVIHWTETSEGKEIPDNSILFPMSDVTPNGLARVSTLLMSGVKAGGDILIGGLKPEVSSIFMSYQINATSSKILPLVTGTTVKHISSRGLSELTYYIASEKEQIVVGTFFHNLDKQIAAQSSKLEQLKQLKSAYLQKMFI